MTKTQKLNYADKYCPSIYNAYSKKDAIKLAVKDIEKVDNLMYELRELIYGGCGVNTALDTATTNYLDAVNDALKHVINEIKKADADFKINLNKIK